MDPYDFKVGPRRQSEKLVVAAASHWPRRTKAKGVLHVMLARFKAASI